MAEFIVRFDAETVLFLQRLGEWLYPVMMFFTIIGSGAGGVLISAYLIWSGKRELGLRLGLIAMLALSLNGILKLFIRQPRPYWTDPRIRGLTHESGFGMPSGHAMQASPFWGYLSHRHRRLRTLVLSLGMILFIGLSRIYLGVHAPSQVVAGWLAGGVVLALFVRLEKPAARAFSTIPTVPAVFLLFAFTAVQIGAAYLALGLNPGFVLPAGWSENAFVFSEQPLDPLSAAATIQSASLFFGLAAGALLFHRDTGGPETLSANETPGNGTAPGSGRETVPHDTAKAAYDAEPGLPDRYGPITMLLRVLTGLAGAGAVFGAFFAAGYAVRNVPVLRETALFLQYALTGGWISLGAPAVFERFGTLSGTRGDRDRGR